MYRLKDPLQTEEGIRNDWYVNDFFDLVIWFDSCSDEFLGFQLCYDKLYNEHSVTYKKGGSFSHDRIQSSFSINGSPMVICNGDFTNKSIIHKFEEESKNIEPGIRNEVLQRLYEYIDKCGL